MTAPSSFSIEQQILMIGARQWHRARHLRLPVQPCLHRQLARLGCEQLAPACDSLMRLAELLLGHPFRSGEGIILSEDEWRLLDLVEGREHALVHECSAALARAFDHAARSFTIMVAMAIDAGAGRNIASPAPSISPANA